MSEKPCYEALEQRIASLEKELARRKQAEEALRESEDRFRLLYEKAPLGYQSLDEKGCFLQVNQTWLDALGYTREEVIGKSFADFLHPDWQDHFKENFPRFKAIGEVLGVEFEMVKKNGSLILVSFNGRIGKDKNGNFQQTHCIFNDITERNRIEKELFFKENIIKSSACAIATCNLEGEMTYGNPFFQKLWGFNAPGEFLGKAFQKFWKVEDRYETIMQALRSEGNWSGELKAEKKDGSLFDVQVSAAVVFDETGTPIAMTSTSIDITEHKAVEAQSRHIQKIEGLGRMAGAIAHNFNNQLQVVIGNLEIAMEDTPRAASPDENLSMAMQAACKAAEVSRLMLIYLGQTSGRYEPMDLSEICRQNLPLLQSSMPEGILLETEFPLSCPVPRANAGQIQQILTNLITNARESLSDKGTIRLTVKTVFHTHIPSANHIPYDWHPREIFYACLEVSDTGCGISKKDMEKIFDPFFTTKFTGRGMGLSVVRGMVKAHGGGVTVDSEPGQGSVFRVYLPV